VSLLKLLLEVVLVVVVGMVCRCGCFTERRIVFVEIESLFVERLEDGQMVVDVVGCW
jgi:hypothetical protein